MFYYTHMIVVFELLIVHAQNNQNESVESILFQIWI